MEIVNLNGKYLILKKLIDEIRKINHSNVVAFNDSFSNLWQINSDSVKQEFNELTNDLLQHAFFVNAFAECGINSNAGFFSEIISKIKHKILPLDLSENEPGNYIQYFFEEHDDYKWLQQIDLQNWFKIFSLLDNINDVNQQRIKSQICNALTILCNRLTTLGIDRSLSSKFPTIDDLGSPFFNLSNKLDAVILKTTTLSQNTIDEQELVEIDNSISDIEKLFIAIQSDIKESGTSLNLIFLLKRAQQHIERIKLLTHILFSTSDEETIGLHAKLISMMVEAEKLKNSIKQFFKTHTQLLAFRIVSHTSQKGESYIGYSKQENKSLFKSAMGGGLIVVFLVYIKHFIHQLHLSLFFEGFLFGLNYGLGFVAMHLLHFTLATKQPALTASFIAESLEHSENNYSKSKKVFSQIIRSQFISLIGNLIVVIPVCFGSAYLFYELWEMQVYSPIEAETVLFKNHLFYSLALFYAVITAFFLSLSGIVIGYIDNKVAYSQIGLRIEKHPKIVQRYAAEKRKKIALFFENNLGAIIGNLFLGFSLGMAGNIGEFIGLPFDIRHVTISAGNFSIALTSLSMQDLALVLTALLTVILIGLINIMVSFLISFILACGSRSISWKLSIKLLFGSSKG